MLFSIILAISPYVKHKVTKRHMRRYGENLVSDIIRSDNYINFDTKWRFKHYSIDKIDKYPKVKYNTFYDIKRAYFEWTMEINKKKMKRGDEL